MTTPTDEELLAAARQAARELADAIRDRDEAVRDMRARGFTLRAIAEAAGMTHTGIRKILARGAAPYSSSVERSASTASRKLSETASATSGDSAYPRRRRRRRRCP